uniref:Ig-like domain-containing protein n=1 Tax=Timema poppense TaxID=170557 RepID=A0A7R9DLH8_TIMPO|nr:unnamed protein product [Timema poppensis]
MCVCCPAALSKPSVEPGEDYDYQNDEDYVYDDTPEEGTGDPVTGPPPVITTKGQVFNAKPGENVFLPCNLENVDDAYVVMWIHGSTTLFTDNVQQHKDARLRRHPNNTLEISRVAGEDSGTYTCKISAQPVVEISHTLNVPSPPKIVRVLPEASNRMLLKGTSLTLQCDAIGHPKPTITWSRSNRNMPSGEKTVQGSSITFDSIDRHHAGTYDCTATNGIDKPARGTITIHVKYAPEIRVDKETVNSGEGYESALLCTVHAEPSATVTWAKDGKPVNLSSHMKSEVDQHTHILKISKTKKEDFGRYTCIANNTVGTKTKVIELTGLPSVAKFLTSSEEGKNQVVQWSIESHSPIIEYILRYRKQNTDEWVIQKPLVENGEGNVFTVRHTLSDLTPGKYEVVLRSQNEFGWSQDSQPHEFTQSSTNNFGEAAFPSSLEASNQPASTGEDTRPRLFALMTLLAIVVFL